jgi:hypothetical protein
MSEIQPALLTRSEIDWLLGKSALSKKTERDLRYRINKKIRFFLHTELPLLKDRGFAAVIGNDAAAISSGGNSTEEYRLVGREIANPELKSNKVVSDKKDIGAGSGNIVSKAPFSAFPPDISNPRVLSDMGLAIPRPTRLGDPRIFVSVFEIIISFANPFSILPPAHVSETLTPAELLALSFYLIFAASPGLTAQLN